MVDTSSSAFVDKIGPEEAKRLYWYWLAKRGERAFPSRKDVDPLDLPFVLGRISLIEVSSAPPRFRFRLVSTDLTEHLGYEMTGKCVEELPEAELRDYAAGFYARAVEARTPIFEEGPLLLDRRRWEHRTLALPLSSDGETIDMLLVFRATSVAEPGLTGIAGRG